MAKLKQQEQHDKEKNGYVHCEARVRRKSIWASERKEGETKIGKEQCKHKRGKKEVAKRRQGPRHLVNRQSPAMVPLIRPQRNALNRTSPINRTRNYIFKCSLFKIPIQKF